MPPFTHLTPQEKGVLIAFLFEEKEVAIEVSMENLGERVFRSNCAACHRATVSPRKRRITSANPSKANNSCPQPLSLASCFL